VLALLDQIDDQSLHTEVCIVGAGPAGITLALELAAKGVNVVLLEGGTLVPPGPDGLDLYRGEISGRKYRLPISRLRYFGGTSGHWGGWCRPLDEVDFAPKPNIEFSG
jgi:choline dehydrogenase-like flavoprotein